MITKIKSKISDLKYGNQLPANSLIVAEFPKSGITWLTHIIANIMIEKRLDTKVTFYNLRTIIPEYQEASQSTSDIKFGHLDVYKTHRLKSKKFKTTVYLVRHPAAVMNSLYHYQKMRKRTELPFSEFIRSDLGLTAWKKHIRSWIIEPPNGTITHLVRYEDLLENTEFEICKLLENVGVIADLKVVRKAIEKSSIVNMKESEKIFKLRDPRYQLGFVRGEKQGISSIDLEFIRTKCRDELIKLGYSNV